EIGDPVGLPGLAAVRREGLLEVGRRARDARPNPAHEDAPAFVQLLVVELAPSVLELADADRLEEALPGAHPVERPLPGGERVQPDGEGVETSAGPLELVLLDVPVAAPDRAAHRRACQVDPLFRSGERALEAADPQLPGAMEEVE